MKLSNNTTVSYYSLVVAIAKRAREIAAEAELKGEILVEKPVDLAVNEYIEGAFRIVEPKECSGKQDLEYMEENEAMEDDTEYQNVCGQIWRALTPEEWGNSLVQQYFFRILNGDQFYPDAYELP